ncbi:hypothetical protein GCM10010372_76230 [Streptomyces tauricus]|nr:hypothetical protein GCM10010372_76230 [Streptomyces tauricus]
MPDNVPRRHEPDVHNSYGPGSPEYVPPGRQLVESQVAVVDAIRNDIQHGTDPRKKSEETHG